MSHVGLADAQVLKDETTLADNGVSEAGFMVVMVTKARPCLLNALRSAHGDQSACVRG